MPRAMSYTERMKRIVVASKNPVKLQATRRGFERMFPGAALEVVGVSVVSDVKDQPDSDSETLQGALNRAANGSRAEPEADFWVGLEGGIEIKGDEMETSAWIVVRDRSGQVGKGRTGTLFLPPKVAELIKQGKELGEADDMVFGTTNSKQAAGAVGLLTHGVVDRTAYYTEAVVFALIPFRNAELYP